MEVNMEIKDIIDRHLIITNLKCQTKNEAFQKMSHILLKEDYISDIENFIRDLYVREAEGQTGIGNFIAIPHSKSPFVKKIGVAIAINQTEIPWETLDGKGVKVIVMFAVGDDNEDVKEHLKLLSLFARKLGNDSVVENLINSKTVDDVISAFI